MALVDKLLFNRLYTYKLCAGDMASKYRGGSVVFLNFFEFYYLYIVEPEASI